MPRFTVYLFENAIKFWIELNGRVFYGSEENGFRLADPSEAPPELNNEVVNWCGTDTAPLEARLANCEWAATAIPVPEGEGIYRQERVWVPSSQFQEILRDFWFAAHNRYYCPPTERMAYASVLYAEDGSKKTAPRWNTTNSEWEMETLYRPSMGF